MSISLPPSGSPSSIPPLPPSDSSATSEIKSYDESKTSESSEEDQIEQDQGWEVLELPPKYFLDKIRGITNTFVSLKELDKNNKVIFKDGKFAATLPQTLTAGSAIYDDLSELAGLSKLKKLMVTVVSTLPGGKVAEVAAKNISLEGILRKFQGKSIDSSAVAVNIITLTALQTFRDIQILSQKLNLPAPEVKTLLKEEKASLSIGPINREDLKEIRTQLIQLQRDMSANITNMRKLAYPYLADLSKYEEINQSIDEFAQTVNAELNRTLKEIDQTLETSTTTTSESITSNTFPILTEKNKAQFIREHLTGILESLQSVRAITPGSGKQHFDREKQIYSPTLSSGAQTMIDNLASSETTVAAYAGKILKTIAEPGLRIMNRQSRDTVALGIPTIQNRIIKTINTLTAIINDKSFDAHQINRIKEDLKEIQRILPDVKIGFENLKAPYERDNNLEAVQTIADFTLAFDVSVNNAIDDALKLCEHTLNSSSTTSSSSTT